MVRASLPRCIWRSWRWHRTHTRLAQLPDDRATRALIAAAQDQTLSREQRKQAVFWLAQSESDAAQSYLEKILTMNATV